MHRVGPKTRFVGFATFYKPSQTKGLCKIAKSGNPLAKFYIWRDPRSFYDRQRQRYAERFNDLLTLWHSWLFPTNWKTLIMTLRVRDWQSESDLDSIRNSCDVLIYKYIFQFEFVLVFVLHSDWMISQWVYRLRAKGQISETQVLFMEISIWIWIFNCICICPGTSIGCSLGWDIGWRRIDKYPRFNRTPL